MYDVTHFLTLEGEVFFKIYFKIQLETLQTTDTALFHVYYTVQVKYYHTLVVKSALNYNGT